jgi:hypothetical protein
MDGFVSPQPVGRQVWCSVTAGMLLLLLLLLQSICNFFALG